MEWRIKQLLKKLSLLGYCSFEIKSIVSNAIGDDSIRDISEAEEFLLVRHLEHYEQLGSSYLLTYSK